MRQHDGEQMMMRIFLRESDRSGSRPLHQAIIEALREEGLAGATALRGVSGFGGTRSIRTAGLLRLSQDLPLVIEAVDERERIEKALARVDDLMEHGLVTLEKVRAIRYGPTTP